MIQISLASESEESIESEHTQAYDAQSYEVIEVPWNMYICWLNIFENLE